MSEVYHIRFTVRFPYYLRGSWNGQRWSYRNVIGKTNVRRTFPYFVKSSSRKFLNAVLIIEFSNMRCLSDEVRRFDGLVLLATECQIYDFIESSIGVLSKPFLRLDFTPCPSVDAGLSKDRLELYRLNVSCFFIICNSHYLGVDWLKFYLSTTIEILVAALQSASGWNIASVLHPWITTRCVCCWAIM